MKKYRVALTGGGTAGHVWPHFALFSESNSNLTKLHQSGQLEIFYFGSHTGMEKSLVTKNAPEWQYIAISTGKLRRYFSWSNFVDIIRVLKGFFNAYRNLKKFQIQVLFSKGGFVAAPVVWAAWLLRIPIFIHESDVTPALATKLTLPFAEKTYICFKETLTFIPQKHHKKISIAGLPMRKTLLEGQKADAEKFFRFAKQRNTILIFGGSLGAEALNKLIKQALPDLCLLANVIHIVGQGKSFHVPNHVQESYRQYEFLQREMPLAYAMADLALSRAGASSIFELAACGVPMLLVPLGLHQSRGDQIVNAKIFEKNGWAQWRNESELNTQTIIEWIQQALQQKDHLKEALRSSPPTDAAKTIGNALAERLMQ